jgi:hypothetical protein
VNGVIAAQKFPRQFTLVLSKSPHLTNYLRPTELWQRILVMMSSRRHRRAALVRALRHGEGVATGRGDSCCSH